MAKILIVDDDKMLCEMVSYKLSANHEVSQAQNLTVAFALTSNTLFDLILLDVRLPDGLGLEALPHFQSIQSQPEIIIITGEGNPEGAELALTTGAWDYIEKPLSMRELTLQVTRALDYRKEKQNYQPKMILKREKIIGNDITLLSCLEKVAICATADISVLITGETGTGKELIARAVHANSNRSTHPFVVLDCAAFPEQLVESVLFGHRKGAFTGAESDQDGLLLQAHGGTLFMDEVGEMPLNLQKSFLRVLQEKKFRPIGKKYEIESDFRLITATNRNLDQMVTNGTFRDDLLYRLKASSIDLPPLRQRKSDIEQLSMHYISLFCKRYGRDMTGVSSEFLSLLHSYNWPGNIRELVNVMEFAVAHSQMHDIILPIHLPVELRVKIKCLTIKQQEATTELTAATPEAQQPQISPPTLKQALEETETRYFKNLMAFTKGNIQKACSVSGLSRSGLYSRFKKYNIDRPV